MAKPTTLNIALTIAGSDGGGGAGIQADLKTFAALGVHGASAITCVTAQNPARISAIEPCTPLIVRRQIQAVFEELPPAAVKTGMLYSAEIIRVVVASFKHSRNIPLVVDPVMVATSGAQLLKPNAIAMLKKQLLPLATLVTPNLAEAASLIGRQLHTVDDMRSTARQIYSDFGCAALVKGGHLKDHAQAVDIFFDGKTELHLTAHFIKGLRTHGTGCTYSAAITAYLALGLKLPQAVAQAKKHITQSIAQYHLAAGHPVLNNFWRRR